MSHLSTSPEKQSLIPQLNPPLPTASPSEVRAFITELLILTRNLPAQHAKDIADKWHLGTGRELTTYPPSVYADIFGSEDAWMVYKESQLFIRRNKQEKNRRRDELRKCMSSHPTPFCISLFFLSTYPLHFYSLQFFQITFFAFSLSDYQTVSFSNTLYKTQGPSLWVSSSSIS
ncbi:hypothetical protein D6C98_10614 [Aureobasidium pullulans]|nr:hypothetical protein D6C98_10614 [Aureobasidium pullulans]